MHKFLFYNKFIICLYMFRVLCAHHQEVKIVLYSIWYHHTCRWPSRAQAVDLPHPIAQQLPQWAKVSALLMLHDDTQTHHSRLDSSRRVISPTQKPLPDNLQHSQQTDIHTHGRIRICNHSKRAAADPRQRLRGHWDLLITSAASHN